MKLRTFNSWGKQGRARTALAVLASFAAMLAANDRAEAVKLRSEPSIVARPVGEPIMAIVSLRDQKITVYDDQGWIMQAPVSSGQRDRETPPGVFTVLQKNADHYSNLYDDAFMPHMQRLTWSGIALHGGNLPGYPASHGCVRMPFDFAERLFSATKLGMRVIVAPASAEPVAIDAPALFQPKVGAAAAAAASAAAAEKAATDRADRARLAAVAANREWLQAMIPVRKMETLKLKADWELGAAQRAVAAATTPEVKAQAEETTAKVTGRIVDLEAQLAAGKAELQPKLTAMTAARDAALASEQVRLGAAEVALKASRALEPVSVFVSRQTQRLYVRQARQPVMEVPVTFRDAERGIGTHIFTATERTGSNIRWSVVSLAGGRAEGRRDASHGAARAGGERNGMTIDPNGPESALARVAIPKDALDFIAERISPRSSFIISDEALSPETGEATEFVVTLSGEPQGGIKRRRPAPRVEADFGRFPPRF